MGISWKPSTNQNLPLAGSLLESKLRHWCWKILPGGSFFLATKYLENIHGRPWKTMEVRENDRGWDANVSITMAPWFGVLNPGYLSRCPWLQVQTMMFNAVSETPKHPLLVFKIIWFICKFTKFTLFLTCLTFFEWKLLGLVRDLIAAMVSTAKLSATPKGWSPHRPKGRILVRSGELPLEPCREYLE